ncbi:MAG: hypothetical protein L0Y64_17530 [Myxococcaceae bacterium]|nr:hypothetical protein [Myxococcaceae bacterium]
MEQQARLLFTHISSGDARAIVRMAGFPFQLEGERLASSDDLHREWVRQLRGKRTDLLALERLEVLTPDQMERKYGTPPPRLAGFPWKEPRTLIAVATLPTFTAVALFREDVAGWHLVGFHD